jgi:hypothetical protein
MVATLILRNDNIKATARHYIDIAPPDTVVKFYKPKRTIPQNDKMWAMLSEVSAQAEHNGQKHSPEVWKALFMHSCNHEVQFVMGLSGEPFPIGFRSSNLTVPQMKDLIEVIYQYGAEKGIVFNDPSIPETR